MNRLKSNFTNSLSITVTVNKLKKNDIHEFIRTMTSFFLSLFKINDKSISVIDSVCLAYKELFETSSPKRIMEYIGPILENLQGEDQCPDNFHNTHSVIDVEGAATKKSIFNGHNDDALYLVHFYKDHLSIVSDSQKVIDIPYKNATYLYGFLLLS